MLTVAASGRFTLHLPTFSDMDGLRILTYITSDLAGHKTMQEDHGGRGEEAPATGFYVVCVRVFVGV